MTMTVTQIFIFQEFFHILLAADIEAENILIKIIILTAGMKQHRIQRFQGCIISRPRFRQFIHSRLILRKQLLDGRIRSTVFLVIIFQDLLCKRCIIFRQIIFYRHLNPRSRWLERIYLTSAHIRRIIVTSICLDGIIILSR